MADLTLLERRLLASTLVARLREATPSALRGGEVDLGPALEQQLYFWLRDGIAPRGGIARRLRGLSGRLVPGGAALATLVPRSRSAPALNGLLAVVRQPVHLQLLAPVRAVLDRRGGWHAEIVRVGTAAGDRSLEGRRLDAHLAAASAASLLRGRTPSPRDLAEAWAGVADTPTALASATAAELPFLRVAAVGLEAAVGRSRPRVLVTYDEVGRWGRLIAAVGSATGVPSVDLPHAEAVDEIAMRGMGFDAIGVFGEVSAERMRAAGFPADRITIIGSPRLDRLAGGSPAASSGGRRVVFASQYLGGIMTSQVKERTLDAVLAASAAVAPCEMVIVPHPVERDGLLERAMGAPHPDGVSVRLARAGTLHDELIGAWALVTGSSQSVIEATALGVPSVTINLTGGPDPVPYAAEGMAIGVETAEAAAAALASLMDDDVRRELLAIAALALERHVGPLDGRASVRAADLIERAAAGG